MNIPLILLGLGIIFILGLVLLYNRFVTLRNNRSQAFADIDVQLRLRYDLIPNLVQTVKGYADHEKSTLKAVTKARSTAMGAQSLSDKAAAESMLSQAIGSLFAVAESYPDLKANGNFLALQEELAAVEHKIAAARRFFNNATKEYNTSLQQFPAALVARPMGFKEEEFFELTTPEEGEAPSITI